ncbi:DUF368 domain-containing protein [Vibrio metschnikovii]|uniref:DUF368 domain-containing protein n=1 Tax=Vibrio metschnikovii TaxID=28172 RepID=UPI001C2FEE29|nr:DUF368 domain-containing protein [Vibrio metschnikovii]EKO3564619.1 DUF368 domain-containing protein [Vibrio metschnikovii]EKO3769310.1 DUF368 domain-containing protein [Vibrio metschnikovii]
MNYLSTFLKGIAMGAADVVPGVSGGTIAFITGIYDTLLESIRRINPHLIQHWQQHGLIATFRYINGGFLLVLFSGIFTSILTLAKFISWLLINQPIPTWSFFFGLIMVSVWHMLQQVEKRQASRFLAFIVGGVFAYTITMINPIQLDVTPVNIVLAGSIAICAMILPGISGSFILLLLGMYTPILNAVKTLQIDMLSLFMFGCILGITSFSHLLSWLLKRYRDVTLTFLTGLMMGTLPKIWPWKETLTWRTNSSGQEVPVLQHNLLPWDYEQLTTQPAQLGIAILCMLSAVIIVLGLEKIAQREQSH